jgi:acetolactate synthase-1/2/3 large subunit
LAEPDRPVIVFCGDAGMEMVLGELATARDQKLAIPIIVFVDDTLALIELKQRSSGYNNLGVDFGRTDFAAVGYAMGGVGVTITDEIALKDELLKAQLRNTFTLMACPIERNAYDGNI